MRHFEQDHLIAGKLMEKQVLKIPRNQFIAEDRALDMNVVLKKFQDFMKAEYRLSDEPFIGKTIPEK